MVDREEIFKRLKEIEDAAGYLEKITEEALSGRDSLLLARYNIQIILEAIFTVGNQIISNKNFKKPENYREILKILTDEKIIDIDFRKIVLLPELRNRLVHTYWKLSAKEILEIKGSQLNIFRAIHRNLLGFLNKGTNDTLQKIRQGEKELRNNMIKPIKSLADLD